MPTKFFLERTNFGRSVDVHMMLEDALGRSIAHPTVFERIGEIENTDSQPPMLKLKPDAAQLLMDELWTIGFRPTQGKQSEGQLSAMGDHLQDMRAIVFDKLKKA